MEYIDWINTEIKATGCKADCLDVNSDDLPGVVEKQLTFSKVNQSWDSLCSCGQNRTDF